jgi:hypothetical protein
MKRHIAYCSLLATLLTWIGLTPSTHAFPTITNVVETGGDAEATDTIIAAWTGVTFTNGVANEPVLNKAATAPYTVGLFAEDVPAFVDRAHQWNGAAVDLPLPRYLVGGEYIMSGNDNRDNNPYQLDISIAKESYVYMLVDNRLSDGDGANPPDFSTGLMAWLLTDGWVAVTNGLNRSANPAWPDEVGVDEGSAAADLGVGPGNAVNNWSSVYVKRTPAGTFSIFQPDNGGRNMYGVVIKPVSTTPIVTRAAGDWIGVVFDVTDGTVTSLDTNTVSLAFNGTNVAPGLTKAGAVTTIRYTTPGPLPSGSTNRAVLTFSDNGSPVFTTNDVLNFIVAPYITIPVEFRLSAADTSKPGYRVKVHQLPVNRNPGAGLVANAERQIAGGYSDPATSQPYVSTIAPNWTHADGGTVDPIGADGFFVIPGLINMHDQAPLAGGGNFSTTSTPPIPDETVPGIPGTSAFPSDYYVLSIETLLELRAGAYRFGVNSDDGFRLSTGRGPGDVVGIQLGTAGDRGFADTLMDFVIAADGFYPFRLMYWETSGNNAGVEFFAVDLLTRQKTLINDLTASSPIRAYRESAASRPYISKVLPAINNAYVIADEDVVVEITDGAIPLNAASAILTINGAAQTITEAKTNKVTTLRRDSSLSNLLFSGPNTNVLVYSFTEGGNNVNVTNTWTFAVPPYTRPIPAANKVLASQVSGAGFKFRPHQFDRSGDTNLGNGQRFVGQGGGVNNMPRPEIQISDGYINRTNNQPYPNLANLTGANLDGTFDVGGVLNLNVPNLLDPSITPNSGIFNNDAVMPGLPGSGTTPAPPATPTATTQAQGTENFAAEILTYLDLKAGAHLFGLNVDDGYVVSSSPNPRDTLGTLLSFRNVPGGNAGSPLSTANAAFNVIVPEDGIFPFRILFWQGNGGVNLEFLTIDRLTGTQILINDTGGLSPSTVANSGNLFSPITAYSTGPVRPWVKFSVYPLPTSATLWQNQHQQSGPGPIQVRLGAGNPVDIANDSPTIRPFGDAVGAVVADLGTGTVDMVLDQADVTPTVTDIPNSSDKLVLYTPNPPLASGSTHTAGLVYAGTTNYWTFTVITTVSIASGVALPSSQADPNAVGFRAKVFQATNAQPNTVARAELQITGGTNNVAIPGSGPNGSYIITNVVNWSSRRNPGQSGAEIGNFIATFTPFADEPIPGVPGTGLVGPTNVAAEIFAYLDLTAGYQKFGVNGDDGWAVKIGTPGVTNGTVLFAVDRNAGARDIPFAFITPEAGLYPIRLVWYQGGGDGNVEFFSYGPNNQKIPINDRTNPNAIKAYYNVITGPQFTSVTLSGGTLTIDWTGSGRLQQASILTRSSNDWSDVQNPSKPYTVQVGTAGQRFYQLVSP